MKAQKYELREDLVTKAIGSQSRNGFAGNTEHRPQVMRPGSMDAFELPSLFAGNRIYKGGVNGQATKNRRI